MSEKIYNFYNGSQNVEHIDKQENHYHYYGVKPEGDNEVNTAAESHELTQDDKVRAVITAINALVNEGEIQNKKDFGAIKKAIDELTLFDKFTNSSMLDILKECTLPSSLMMKGDSSLKSLGITGTLPKWTIQGVTPEEKSRLIKLGESFKILV